jgi:hypothetical protein
MSFWFRVSGLKSQTARLADENFVSATFQARRGTRLLKLETRNPKLSLPHHCGVFGLDFVEDSYFAGLAVGIFIHA